MCCNNRERLPGKNDDADDDDDDDAGDMSIADMAATDDEVAEILTKYMSQLQHIICAQIHHILWEQFSTLHSTISNIVHFFIFQLEIVPQVPLYRNCHDTHLSHRYIQYHDIYHINHRIYQIIFIMCL